MFYYQAFLSEAVSLYTHLTSQSWYLLSTGGNHIKSIMITIRNYRCTIAFDLSNFYLLQAAGCNKINYYNRSFPLKTSEQKPASSPHWTKSNRGQKQVPLLQVCSLRAPPLLVLAFQIIGASQLPHRPSPLLFVGHTASKSARRGMIGIISAAGLSVS